VACDLSGGRLPLPRGDSLPAVVVVSGSSMAPGLRPGWRLRVVPIDGAPAPGDVVVLRSGVGLAGAADGTRQSNRTGAESSPRALDGAAAAAFVVHRVVWIGDAGGRRLVFHRGDADGRIGVTTPEAVVGRVAGVLGAPDVAAAATAVPALDSLAASQRRAFARAQRRCRAYVALRRLAARVSPARARDTALGARVAALARRLLLRA
jgi:hypothetical protein